MTTLREAAQQALEALEEMDSDDPELNQEWLGKQAITALRAALAEPDYASANPLGGPAVVFDAIARRLRSGEGYDAVLADYGLQHIPAALAEPVQEPVQEPVAWIEGPFGELRRNPLWRLDPTPPQTVAWSIPLYLGTPQRKQAEPVQDHFPDVTKMVQEPVAWRFEARHIDSAWAAAVTLKHPGPEGVYMRNVMPLYTAPPQRQAEPVQEPVAVFDEQWGQPVLLSGAPLLTDEQPLYTAPPQRKPLTDDQLDDIAVAARRGNLYDLRIAIERANGIGGEE